MILKTNTITTRDAFTELFELKNTNQKRHMLLYDLIHIYQNKYYYLSELKDRYNEILKGLLERGQLKMIGFDYTKNKLIVAYGDGGSFKRKVYPDMMEETQFKNLDKQIITIFDQFYQIYQDYRDFFTTDLTCDSINSDCLINLNYKDITVILANGFTIKKSLRHDTVEFINTYYSGDSVKNLNKLFSYLELNIHALPPWIQEEYLKVRKNKTKKRILSFWKK